MRARFGVPVGMSVVLHLVAMAAVPWRDRTPPVRVTIIDESDIHGAPSGADGTKPPDEREVVVADGDGEAAEEKGLAALSRLWTAEEEARKAEAAAQEAEVRALMAGRAARAEMRKPRRAFRQHWTPSEPRATPVVRRPTAPRPAAPVPVATVAPPPPSEPTVVSAAPTPRVAPAPPTPDAPTPAAPPTVAAATPAPRPDPPRRAADEPSPPVASATPPPPAPSPTADADLEARKLDANLARAEAEARKVVAVVKRAEADRIRREVETRLAAREFDPATRKARRPPAEPADPHDLERKKALLPKPIAQVETPEKPDKVPPPASVSTRPPPATATRAPHTQTAAKPTARDRVATPTVKPVPKKPKATGTTPPVTERRERKVASAAPAEPKPPAPKPAPGQPGKKSALPRPPAAGTTPGKRASTNKTGGNARAEKPATEDRDTKARRADAEHRGRADGEAGGTGTGPGTRWLRYVHTDGTPSGDPVTDALYIGGRDVFVARQTWAPTNTERSFGTGKVRGDAIPGVESSDALIGFESGESTADADGLFLDSDDEGTAPALAGADSRAPIGAHLHLSMLLTDPGDGTTPPMPERHSPRTDLPRPTREAPVHKTDGVATTASAGAVAPPAAPEEDTFWSPIVGDEPSPAAGAARRDGTAWSSLEVVDTTFVRGEVASAKVQKTDVGVWMDTVDDRIRQASRLPLDLRARGYSGVVQIDMRIRRNGTIERLRVVRSSGVLELDQIAIAAIPAQVEPPPIPDASLALRYTFRFGT